jgi:hypothetical protein
VQGVCLFEEGLVSVFASVEVGGLFWVEPGEGVEVFLAPWLGREALVVLRALPSAVASAEEVAKVARLPLLSSIGKAETPLKESGFCYQLQNTMLGILSKKSTRWDPSFLSRRGHLIR